MTAKLSDAQVRALEHFERHTDPTAVPLRTVLGLFKRGLILKPLTFDGAPRHTALTFTGEAALADARGARA